MRGSQPKFRIIHTPSVVMAARTSKIFNPLFCASMLIGMHYQPSSHICDRFDTHWRYTLDLVAGLRRALFTNAVPRQTTTPKFWRILHHEITLAETLLRRLLVLIAMTMNIAPVPRRIAKSDAPCAQKIQPGPKPPRVHAPRFSLFDRLDPLPRDPSVPPRPSGPPPRFWMPGMDEMCPPLPAAPNTAPSRDTAPLIRRLSALQDALAHPGPHAARMARWILRRQMSAQAAGYLPQPNESRDCPLCYGRPPGVTKKRLGDMIHAVRRLSFDAHAALCMGFDTS